MNTVPVLLAGIGFEDHLDRIRRLNRQLESFLNLMERQSLGDHVVNGDDVPLQQLEGFGKIGRSAIIGGQYSDLLHPEIIDRNRDLFPGIGHGEKEDRSAFFKRLSGLGHGRQGRGAEDDHSN